MTFAKLVLYLSAATFAGFGGWLMVAPEALEGAASLGLSAPEARAEIRAMYGGLELGIAAYLLWCAGRPARYQAGLTLSALAFFGLGTGRLAGMAIESAWTATHLAALSAETVAIGLSWAGLAALGRSKQEAG